MREDAVEINIGTMMGVEPGQRYRAIDRDVLLQVVRADQDASVVRVSRGKEWVRTGMKVAMIGDQEKK
jgi:hypothetical protein